MKEYERRRRLGGTGVGVHLSLTTGKSDVHEAAGVPMARLVSCCPGVVRRSRAAW